MCVCVDVHLRILCECVCVRVCVVCMSFFSIPLTIFNMIIRYACNETEELMPLSHILATRLGARLTEVRKTGLIPWVRPDGKTQVCGPYPYISHQQVPLSMHILINDPPPQESPFPSLCSELQPQCSRPDIHR